jgi:hypothetical protein
VINAVNVQSHEKEIDLEEMGMNVTKSAAIIAQLLATLPSVLLMGALVVRALPPLQNEPAHNWNRYHKPPGD